MSLALAAVAALVGGGVAADPDDGWVRALGLLGEPASEGFSVRGRLEGAWASWHPSGFLADLGAFRFGREQGPWLSFDEDGRLAASGEWRAGQPHGAWAFYHPSGGVASAGAYVDGARAGLWVERFADGTVLRTTRWEGGVAVGADGLEAAPDPAEAWCRDFGLDWQVDLGARSEGCFDEEGRRVGRWRGFHPSGAVAWERTWAAGVLDEEAFDYHPDGALLHAGLYRIGAPDGQHVWSAPDGRVYGVSEIVGGTGPWRAFHPDGALAEDGAWLGYRRDGTWRTWDADGRLVAEVAWRRGQRVHARLVVPAPDDGGLLTIEGAYVDGQRAGPWVAWTDDGACAWRGGYTSGARTGAWRIGGAELTFDADEPLGVTRWWPSGALREVRTPTRWTALEADGSVLAELALEDGAAAPPPDPEDPDAWERARDIQAWLLADPHPSAAELEATATPPDERADVRPRRLDPNEPAARDAVLAEGPTNDDDVPHGRWTYFHPNGALEAQGELVDGARVGLWRGWDEDERLRWEAEYVADRLDGAWRSYHPDGVTLWIVGRYRAGERVDTWTWYHADGTPRVVGAYVDGRAFGPWRAYHASGEVAWTGAYAGGKRTGTWIFRDPAGRELMRAEYVEGRERQAWLTASTGSRSSSRCSGSGRA